MSERPRTESPARASAQAHDRAGEGFLSRWSRRKVQEKQGADGHQVEVQNQTAAHQPLNAKEPAQAKPATSAAHPSPEARAPGAEPPPSPTMDDVERLDAQSDYRAFVGRDVDPEVRNAAMRKLFHSDPHFNVMDGLDVYIDDYNTPMPLPKAVMQTLMQARVLGLIDDELKEQDLPSADKPVAADAAPPAAQNPTPVQDARTEPAEPAEQVEHVQPQPATPQPGHDPAATEAAQHPHAGGAVVIPFPRRPDPGESV